MTEIIKDVNLDKFKPREAELKAKAESYKGLKINGIDDKDGYKKVHEAQMDLRADRIEVEKFFKQVKDNINAERKKVFDKEDEIVGLISPIEEQLKSEKKRIDEEKERIQREKEEAEAKRIQDRMDKMQSIGVNSNLLDISLMSDEDFETLYNSEKIVFEEKEKIRIAEEEAIRIQAEKDAEELRILRQKQSEIEEKERKLEEEKAQIARDKEMEEFKKKAEQEANERAEKNAILQKLEDEKRAKEEKEAKEKAEKENQARLEKETKYKKWLKDNEGKYDRILKEDTRIVLIKEISEFKI